MVDVRRDLIGVLPAVRAEMRRICGICPLRPATSREPADWAIIDVVRRGIVGWNAVETGGVCG